LFNIWFIIDCNINITKRIHSQKGRILDDRVEVFCDQLFSRLSALLLCIFAPEAAPIIHWFRGRCFQALEASWCRETIKSRFYAWSASGCAWLVYLNLGTQTVYTLIRSIFILLLYDFLILLSHHLTRQ